MVRRPTQIRHRGLEDPPWPDLDEWRDRLAYASEINIVIDLMTWWLDVCLWWEMGSGVIGGEQGSHDGDGTL